jgi:preprotein translocase subunit SecG
MFTAVIVVICIVSVLLVLVVLAQNSKGGGAGQMMGASSNQLLGVAQTGDLLEKLTWGFAIVLISLCLFSNFVVDRPEKNEQGTTTESSANIEKAMEAGQPSAPINQAKKDSSKK